MKKFILVVFVIALVIVAYETFKPQAPFPNTNTASLTQALQMVLNVVKS